MGRFCRLVGDTKPVKMEQKKKKFFFKTNIQTYATFENKYAYTFQSWPNIEPESTAYYLHYYIEMKK